MIPLLLPVILSALAANPTASAICDLDDVTSCVQPLSQGEAAPFAGQLLTNKRAAKLAVLAGGCQDRIDLNVAQTQAIATVQLQGAQALRVSDKEACGLQRDLLLQRMAEMKSALEIPWYERPAFVSVVSAVTTVAVLALAVKTVQILK